jgi:fumarylacetoacetase
MTHDINATHDPQLASWVEAANDPRADFPVQNLPFGVFTRRGSGDPPRGGVAIGDRVLDVSAAAAAGLVPPEAREAAATCARPRLNALMALPPAAVSALRRAVGDLLRSDGVGADAARARAGELLVPMTDADLHVPAAVGDYTDFYASIHHATNVGSMFRPDSPLLPNYKYVPIGYHGRASSIVASGTPVRRPRGQVKPPDASEPAFAPTRLLDYEAEVGMFVAGGNALGDAVGIDAAAERLFGLCLVNDWSARDVQAWEYQPLGPFLAKSFATTVSPWVVTTEALAPFRAPALARPASDPAPLPYLRSARDQARGAVRMTIEVELCTAAMRAAGAPAARLSRAEFAEMYWTPAQLLAHHASNGCNLRPGDLLASGTVSGPEREARGCLLELTWRGAEPLTLPGGETRGFLADGDEVVMRASCEAPGARRIGFGDCRGVVLPAAALPSTDGHTHD